MTKILWVILSFLALTATSFGAQILQGYECPTEVASLSCNSACNKTASYSIEFKVNKESSLVNRIEYQKGTIESSVYLNNCQVVDEKNWSYDNSSGRMTHKNQMIKGIYSSKFQVGSTTSFGCAK